MIQKHLICLEIEEKPAEASILDLQSEFISTNRKETRCQRGFPISPAVARISPRLGVISLPRLHHDADRRE